MKVVLAGAHGGQALDNLIAFGAPNVLASYYYLRDRKDRGRSILEKIKGDDKWLLCDSGVFTIKENYVWLRRDLCDESGRVLPKITNLSQQTVDEARQKMGNPSRQQVTETLREYLVEYMAWLDEFKEFFNAASELDVDLIVDDAIWEWRQELKAHFHGTGLRVIFTPHLGWDDRLLDSEYIGIAEPWIFEQQQSKIVEAKIPVHGWAMTSYEAIIKRPYYSVDSTSWCMGSKYGMTYRYPGGHKLDVHGPDYKDRRKAWAEDCRKAGVSYEDFVNDVPSAVNRFNAYQWSEFAKAIEHYNTNAYWMTADERAADTEEGRQEWRTSLAVRRHSEESLAIADDPKLGVARFCSTCFLNTKCPAYEKDTTCSLFNRPDVRDARDMASGLMALFGVQLERAVFAAMAERVQGTPLGDDTTKQIKGAFELARVIKELADNRDEITVKAKGSGILEKIFGAKKDQ